MRSACELLCYSKGEVLSADFEHSLPTLSAAPTLSADAITLPVAGDAGLPRSPEQDGLYSKQLEQQLSATRQLLRQATSALEDAKTEREKLTEQVRKTEKEMQIMKTDLANTKAQLQDTRSTTEKNAAGVASLTAIQEEVVSIRSLLRSKNPELNSEAETVRSTTAESDTRLIDTIKDELAGIKDQLKAVMSKAEQNAATMTAKTIKTELVNAKDRPEKTSSEAEQNAATKAESNADQIDTIKVDLAGIKRELKTISYKEEQNAISVKASQNAMIHLKGTAQLLLKLLLERTRSVDS